MAEENKKKNTERNILIAAGVGGGAILLYSLSKGGGSSAPARVQPGKPSRQTTRTPNPNDSAVESAFYAARTASVESYEQLLQTLSTNRTLQLVTFNTNAAQTKQAQIGATSAQAIASTEANAQIQGQQIQANALQNQQSQQNTGNWISSILGFLPGIFGFNMGSSNTFAPDSSNDAINQTPQLPPVFDSNEFLQNILEGGFANVG